MKNKKLPIGIQSLKELIEGGYIYIDKTSLALKLIDSGKYYFMSRPRRFGKSLFVSTLEEILVGNQKLFENCHIFTSDYDWKPHPVIHLDFTKIPTTSSDKLENGLIETLDKIATRYGLELTGNLAQLRLVDLVEKLSTKANVAVLIDEYDKPIIDNLNHPEVVQANRELVRSFFGTLKGLDKHLKFVFITGVSKFAQVSIFSGFNNLDDITIDTRYATLMGYTKEEIENNFAGYVDKISKEHNTSKTQILKEVKEWYNGYRFSEDLSYVYNPFSTLNYMSKGRCKSYWFRTGTPSFLIDQVQKAPALTTQLSGILATESELLNIQNIEHIDLKALMWQTGYLTISGHDPKTDLYQLDFPNKEVRSAFFDSLLQEFARISPSGIVQRAEQCIQNLKIFDFETFIKTINSHFASIPYNVSSGAKEGFYHAVFLSFLEGMGIKTRSEEQTNIGRIDLSFELYGTIYIFEFKVDQDAKAAIDQIQAKNYQQKYEHLDKNLMIIGINFCTEKRNISDWVGLLFNSKGQLQETFTHSAAL